MTPRALWLATVLGVLAAAAPADAGMRESAHNLSPSGLQRLPASGQATVNAAAGHGEDEL
jgi:hypothetical protein